MKNITSYVGKQIKKYRQLSGMTQRELGLRIGVKHNTISSYENGINDPDQNMLFSIANALGVSINNLFPALDEKDKEKLPDNLHPIKTKKVPMLGEIAAGVPILCNENFAEYYVETDITLHVDFCLKVKGDSMVDARINDGDLVFIRKQPVVENGEIAAVVIDNEVTLKRFYKNEKGVILKPENRSYQPKFYTEKDFKEMRVLGKAVLLQGEVK